MIWQVMPIQKAKIKKIDFGKYWQGFRVLQTDLTEVL